jgi:predicted lipid-binding transport protein (Tim44 family)
MLSLRAAWRRLRPRRRRQPGAGVPPGLDVEQFLRLARLSFVHLQAAWDAADLPTLERLTTGPLLAELREQLQARGGEFNRTDVLDLQARLLAFEELREAFVASVEFSGLIREGEGAAASEFRELWLLTRLKPGTAVAPSPPPEAWQLAQVQALA